MILSNIHPNFVFCPPPPGKPNPHEPSSQGNRSRVRQNEQKGANCTFYALQILRNEKRIGKHPTHFQLKDRQYEKLFSEHRKQLTQIKITLQPWVDFSQELTTKLERSCTKEDAKGFLSYTINQMKPEYQEVARASLQAFCNQEIHSEFSIFAQAEFNQALFKANDQLNEQLSESMQTSNLLKYKESYEKKYQKSWETSTLFEKVLYQDSLIFIVQRYFYRIQISPWHPEQPIECLIQEMQLHGPHLVRGHIGQLYYEEPPFQLNNCIEERPIFGWKSNAKRKEMLSYHVVVLVGAKVTDDTKGYVYFIDPLDGSDPDPKTQKVYMISYERLKSIIAPLDGFRMQTKEGAPTFLQQQEGGNNYAGYI